MTSIPNSLHSPFPILSDDVRKTRIAACSVGCGDCVGTGNCTSKHDTQHVLHAIAGKSADSTGSANEDAVGALTGNDGSILMPEEQVLPTLNRDGKRKWINPSIEQGPKWNYRRWVAYALIAFFVVLPHLRIDGKPYVLIDIATRQFTFLGHTFYPTDTPLLACLTLATFFSVMLVTSLAGRVWCGWGCPQTVYMEFLFRPIDRMFQGTVGKGGKSKREISGAMQFARVLVYLVCCMFLAHVFLSYFIGTDRLAHWIVTPPTEHPAAFLIMAGTTLAMMFHFLYFREQLCLIACPYGRFQSVMLDRKSLIVAYDPGRGEPRKKGKRQPLAREPLTLEVLTKPAVGDCVDCGRCTAVCPTGIDIRNGLQLECIHCAQCVDACNAVMGKVGLPTGLIRYTSQDGLEGKKASLFRARTMIYSAAVTILVGLFFFILSFKFAFDARILRQQGSPFTVRQDRMVQNNFRLRLVNRSQGEQQYNLSLADNEMQVNWSGGEPIVLKPGDTRLVPIDILFPTQKTSVQGSVKANLVVADSAGAKREIPIQLLGPR
jgi:cytochrome c oxidase accessory protein FixG